MELTEERKRKKIHDLCLGKELFNKTSKAWETKSRIDK